MTWLRDRLPCFYRDSDGDACLEWVWDRNLMLTVCRSRETGRLYWAWLWGQRHGHGAW